MAIADIYECRVSGNIFLVPFNLVFHVVRANAGFGALEVTDACADTVLPDLLPVSTSDAIYQEISAYSLGDATDFWTRPLGSTAGTHTGDAFSPFATYSIRFNRMRTDMHHGYKRIPGVDEASVTDGVLTQGTVTLLQTAAASIVGNWEQAENPGTNVCNYVVVKRVLVSEGKYRLPKTDGELITYQPTGYAILNAVTTQNSRKF